MAEAQKPTAGAEAQLSLQDISAMVQVIDVVSQRGAIRGDELVPVGTLRQRLVDFLTEAQKNGQKVDIPQPTPQAVEEAAEAVE